MTRKKADNEGASRAPVPSKKAAAATKPAPPQPKPQPFRAPKPLASFVPALTRTAFEKFGFSAVALITDWPQIVGPDLARWTAPEKVKWPKPSDTDIDATDPRQRGAVLHLRVEGPRALEIEYRRQEVADRINAYFGYRAISDVRIIQAPLPKKKPENRTRIEPQDAVALPAVGDETLRSALERLGRGVKARARATRSGSQKS